MKMASIMLCSPLNQHKSAYMHAHTPSKKDVLNDVILWHDATSRNRSAAAHAQRTTVCSRPLHPLCVEGKGERHLINGALGIKFRRHVGSSDQMRHDSSLGQLCLQLLFDTIDMRARQHCLFHTTRQHDTSTRHVNIRHVLRQCTCKRTCRMKQTVRHVLLHTTSHSAMFAFVCLCLCVLNCRTASSQQMIYSQVQPLTFGVSFNLILQSQSNPSVFNRTWQKRKENNIIHRVLRLEK